MPVAAPTLRKKSVPGQADPSPALSIQSLLFKYPGSADWTVNLASLTLQPGEQLLLTGPSGRGKSTLLHLIAGLEEPAQGSVAVAGQNIHDLRGPARDRFRGRSIGMIFQTFNLLPGFSVIENVLAALMFSSIPASQHHAHAAKLLNHLGITDHQRDVTRLSVGQQQRVAVARAVACKPALVLADEPTASLDPDTAATAIHLIQQSCKDTGAALLCTSHDPAMIERFPRTLSLDQLRAT